MLFPDHNCSIIRGDTVRHAWERSLSDYLNGSPIERVFPWEHLLNEDISIVQSALSVCRILSQDIHNKKRQVFLEKLATVIPNSHSRNILIQFYVELLVIYQDSSDLLIKLVKFYPLAVTSINILLKNFFLKYLQENPHKGEDDSEIIVWSKNYFTYLFESKDLYSATKTLHWLSQFKYRAVHEFLLSTASNITPQIRKPDYWLLLYDILQIVVPGPPPTLISSNRYASVLFSVSASVLPGSPITPQQFLLESCQRADQELFSPPILYSNISLTPGLMGLAAYVMTKYPTPSLLPFIRSIVNVRQGANIHLFGCFMYPLSIIGGINNSEVKKEVTEIMCSILNMKPCPPEQRDYIAQDGYSEKCIKTEATLISLKLGQILSYIAENGLKLIEERLQKTTLTTFSAIVLCHCIVISEDRPSQELLKTLQKSDDSTNLSLLTFLITHMKLIGEKKVRQSAKFYHLYLQSICSLMKNASSMAVKKMVKMVFSDGGPLDHESVYGLSYQVMLEIWKDHGGLVYNTFYSMLANPKFPDQETFIIPIIRSICSSEIPTDIDDMQRIIFRYMDSSTDVKIKGACIDSLTYLCMDGLDFHQIYHNVISQFVDEKQYDLQLCFFFSKFASNCQKPEVLDDIVSKLWGFALSSDVEVSSMGYRGLMESGIGIEITPEIFTYIQSLTEQRATDYPQFSAEFLADVITRELQNSPAREIGTLSNPSKKLMNEFKANLRNLSKQNLTQVLYTFSHVDTNTGRQKHKQKLLENERILSHILKKYPDDLFQDPFDGIVIIDSWCHFMYAYMTSIIDLPTYQRRNRGDISSSGLILDQLLRIKDDVSSFINDQLQNSSNKMYILILTSTSITLSTYKIAQKYEITIRKDSCLSGTLARDIGLLRTLTAYNRANKEVKTNAILLLCSAYVAKIACEIGDESLLQMLLETCTTNIDQRHELVSQCASLATGVIIHVYYKFIPKTASVKSAIQNLLSSKKYLGLSFCIDSLSNTLPKHMMRKFVDDFVVKSTNKEVIPFDHILFVGLIMVFLMHVDTDDEKEIVHFLAYLSNMIDECQDETEQKYCLITMGLVYYSSSKLQYSIPCWKKAYQHTIEVFVSKFSDGYGAIPTLSLLLGFPITNLVNIFDWGPSVDSVTVFANLMSKNTQYDDGRLCALIVARRCESEFKHSAMKFKKMPSPSIWELVDDMIQSSLLEQTPKNKEKLRFALEILSHTKCKIPLDNPLQTMVNIFTLTSLQHEVIRCAGIHGKISSEHYFKFIEKYMSLSIYPQLSLQCKIEIISQIPNFIQFIPEQKLRNFFSNFVHHAFWEGTQEIRLKILEILQFLHKTVPSMRSQIYNSSVDNFFRHMNVQFLTPKTIVATAQLMKFVDFHQVELNNLAQECDIVLDFLKSGYHLNYIVDLFFERYLQAELYSPELLRGVVNVILSLDKDTAYNNLYKVMFHIKKALLINPEPENFMNPAIACINTVILTYVAHLKDTKSLGNGLEHFLYLSDFVEPKVNLDCLHVVMSTIEPWFQIIRLYDDVLPDE